MNVFGRSRPPGPRACNANTYGLRRLILIHGEGGNININAGVCLREGAAGRRKSHGAELWETASSTHRLDEVGNGNLGVPLLPTMLPTISRFQASGKTREMREVAGGICCELTLLNINF